MPLPLIGNMVTLMNLRILIYLFIAVLQNKRARAVPSRMASEVRRRVHVLVNRNSGCLRDRSVVCVESSWARL